MDYLTENLKMLQTNYPITLTKVNGVYKVTETKGYWLNNNEDKKTFLKSTFGMKWNGSTWLIEESSLSVKYRSGPNKSVDDMRCEIKAWIETVSNNELREFLTEMFKTHSYFFECPAAVMHHHNYKHGLVEHTLEVVNLVTGIINSQFIGNSVNDDVLIAGALLHDIGKLDIYDLNGNSATYKQDSRQINHITSGLFKIGIGYNGFPETLLKKITHVIEAHHGQKDWGSVVEPQTKEAWLVHFADNISAHIDLSEIDTGDIDASQKSV